MRLIFILVHSSAVAIAAVILLPALIVSAETQKSPTNSVQTHNLKPHPNPLLFPTKPEEVQIQGTVAISLAQALELAQRHNKDLQIAKLGLERSRFALRESQSVLFPTLGLSGNTTNNGNAFTSSASPATTTFNGQVQLKYNLYTSGNRDATIRAAQEQLRFDELAVETQTLTINLNVTTQYYALQTADEQVRINRSAVENSQASLRDAQARLQAGVGTKFDVLQTQVTLANSQQTLTNAVAQQLIAQRQLAALLSLPQSVNISAADPVKLAGLWQPTLQETIIQALQNRPELQQQLAQRNIYEQQRRKALSVLGPQISLTGSYSLLDQYKDGVGVADGYSVGAQATLSLFDGGVARAQAAQSKANIAIAETQFASQRDQIRFNVEQYYFQLQSNLQNVQTSTLALDQAKESLRLSRIKFQAGVGTQTDVISAENALTQAEGNRVTAIVNYNLALANLQRSAISRTAR